MVSEMSHFRNRTHWKRRYPMTATVLRTTNLQNEALPAAIHFSGRESSMKLRSKS